MRIALMHPRVVSTQSENGAGQGMSKRKACPNAFLAASLHRCFESALVHLRATFDTEALGLSVQRLFRAFLHLRHVHLLTYLLRS
jgi:hypothetical protein